MDVESELLGRKERIMRSYMVKFPIGIEVDIFDLPEDFEEQIKSHSKDIRKKLRKNIDIVTSLDILIAVSSI